ncbi:MAG: hypothetical protein ERJ67_08030 [Aphanocapsa feldmannii 277cV]|uniref:Uncharacterized protein n=1 Tax=Aphanocapsa feldmannii 277cV TaxID=2507553 RepID=A0A524RM82_9CHRO|nr:MAG: hypothetical protein ERJ67_08030 [Aphanocapsa feldmannii 277cV]
MAQAAESWRGLPLQLNALWLPLPWVEEGPRSAMRHRGRRDKATTNQVHMGMDGSAAVMGCSRDGAGDPYDPVHITLAG